MTDSTKETLTTSALVIVIGLMCGGLGIIGGIAIGENRSVERFLSIEKRLDLHGRIDSVLVASINAFYEYVGVEWEIRSVKQDTVTTLPGPVILNHNPIPPPAGFEAQIKRSVYQNLKKPRVADTVKEDR